MQVKQYKKSDAAAVYALWNTAAPLQGFIPLTKKEFTVVILQNPYFENRFAFVLKDNGHLQGFACGAASKELPGGQKRGYFSCLLLAQEADNKQNAALLLAALEDAFSKAGCIQADVLFFNPIKLPWAIPNTAQHIHNNAPGVWVETPLYGWLLEAGYQERAQEQAMYMNLQEFTLPQKQQNRRAALQNKGYQVELYNPEKHDGLKEMLRLLENTLWQSEISKAAETKLPFLVASDNKTVVGFAGPIYPEASGRGYFAGIGVVAQHEGHGLGTLLFYMLCQEEKAAGAAYMSLFTGENNPAAAIYQGAGFAVVRKFAVMRKMLNEMK